MRAHLTRRSSNRKTGKIAVSTISSDTCPDTCPLKSDGSCYASAGFHLAMHWRKVDTGERGTSWSTFLQDLQSLPENEPYRHGQAGDLPGDGDRTLDRAACVALGEATSHLDGWGYTHYLPTAENVTTLRAMADTGGLVVNLSADNLGDVDTYRATGLPVVVTLPEDAPERSTTPDGAPIVVCPAQTGKAPDCKACMLCARPNRRVVVGFRAHGAKRALVADH